MITTVVKCCCSSKEILMRRSPTLVALTCCLGLTVVARADTAQTGELNSLEKELIRQAPAIVKYLQEHHYQNVGVLKFRVKKSDQDPISDNVGPLNMNMARRLEVALVLANTDDGGATLGVIKNASAVAAKTPGANHLNPEGQKRLFQGRYKLAWGNGEVAADAFLTGVVCLNKPVRGQMTVFLRVSAKESEKFAAPVPAFSAAMDTRTLDDAGETYTLRGLFDRPKAGGAKERQALAVKDALDSASAI